MIRNQVSIPSIFPNEISNGRAECKDGNSSSGSFTYDSHKEEWGCFKCKNGGDVVNLYAHLHYMSYKEAMTQLALENNIALSEETKKQMERKHEVDEIHAFFCKLCEERIQKVKKGFYFDKVLKDRGFTKETMVEKRIGLFDSFIKQKMAEKYTKEDLQDAGFINKDGNYAYAKRIVYPYLNQNSRPTFFIFRVIKGEPDFSAPNPKTGKKGSKYNKLITTGNKYIEHPLYGLDSIVKQGAIKKALIITEGITDAISCHAANYPCLSPVTTHFAKRDYENIAQYCKRFKKIVVVMDNEVNKQGLKGAIEAVKILVGFGINVFLGTIPNPEELDKVDLDDYIKAETEIERETLVSGLVENAVEGLSYLVKQLSQDSTDEDIKALIRFTFNSKGTIGVSKRRKLKAKLLDQIELNSGDYSEYEAQLKLEYKEAKKHAKKSNPDEMDGVFWYDGFEEWFKHRYSSNGHNLIVWDDRENEWFQYSTTGVWNSITDTFIDRIIIKWGSETVFEIKNKHLILGKKRLRTMLFLDGSWDEKTFVNFTNGIFILETKELVKHSPAYKTRQQLKIRFMGEDIPTPYWDKIRKIYPDQITKFETMIHRTINQDFSEEAFVVIVGGTSSGKGTIFQILTETFGNGMISNTYFHKLGGEFGLSPLVGKRVILNREMIIAGFTDATVGILKDLVTHEGTYDINQKHKPKYEADLPIFVFGATNQLVSLPAGTDKKAFFRRTIIIVMNQAQKRNSEFKENIRLETPAIISNIILNNYEPIVPENLDEFAKSNEILWEEWSDPILRICESIFKRGEGNENNIDAQYVVDAVLSELNNQRISLGIKYIKQRIAQNLKQLYNVDKRRKKNNIYRYIPLQFKDDALQDLYAEWIVDQGSSTYNSTAESPKAKVESPPKAKAKSPPKSKARSKDDYLYEPTMVWKVRDMIDKYFEKHDQQPFDIKEAMKDALMTYDFGKNDWNRSIEYLKINGHIGFENGLIYSIPTN